jgi:hypothetical protein
MNDRVIRTTQGLRKSFLEKSKDRRFTPSVNTQIFNFQRQELVQVGKFASQLAVNLKPTLASKTMA